MCRPLRPTYDIANRAEVRRLESDLLRFHHKEGSTCTTRNSLITQYFRLVVDFIKAGREREDGGSFDGVGTNTNVGIGI